MSETLHRILERVEVGDCWVWTGGLCTPGYGQIRVGSSRVLVHRAVYESLVGDIPDGLTLDHLCRNRRCVNPDHLEPITKGENVLRGVGTSARNARKTHCLRGHEFNEANTYRPERGGRECRACARIRKQR